MVNLSKGSAILFLSTFVCVVSGQFPVGNGGYAGNAGYPGNAGYAGNAGNAGYAGNAGNFLNGKLSQQKKIAEPLNLNVNYPAQFGIPIELHTPDYSGPYDPIDPNGLMAAGRRQTKIMGERSLETVKSYIPPDLGRVVKKEAIRVALNEGRRFAFAHPKETAEIIGIATKAKALYDTASHKVRAYESQGH